METHVTSNIDSTEICLSGFTTVRCNSVSSHTGGIVCYVKEQWQVVTLESVSTHMDWWILVIKVSSGSQSFILAGLYRSPSSSLASFCDCFKELMERTVMYGIDIILMGDFNIDWLVNSTYKIRAQQVISDNACKQLISEPTRITPTSRTLLDYVVTNSFRVHAEVVKKWKISDHESIEITIETRDKVKNVKKQIQILKYSKSSFCDNLIGNIDLLNNIFNCDNVNIMGDNFCNMTACAVDSLKITKTVNATDRNEWYSNELKRMRDTKILKYNQAIWSNTANDWQNYRVARNRFKAEINKAKNKYVSNKVQGAKDQKSMWRIIKSLVLNQKKSSIKSINFDNVIVDDKYQLAEKLNHFFVKSVIEINKLIPNVSYYDYIEDNDKTFRFEFVTFIELKTFIKNMKNKKDANMLSVNMISDSFHIVGDGLCRLVNESLREGIFPDCWKESMVVPIAKVNNPLYPEEYRPVNMLPNDGKILEKIVQKQLQKYMEESQLFVESQSGFREGHSCESLINLIIADWKTAVHQKMKIVAVFIDLRRAFETLDREILLKKLYKYGVKNKELSWFQSYLQRRTQRTKVEEAVSESINVNLGVPQGSVLGTLLFIIYVNEMPRVVRYSFLKLFADDGLLYFVGKSIEECIEKVNFDLMELNKWFHMNKLSLNVGKTKCMYINGESETEIKIDNQVLEVVENIKYLGIMFDNKLEFNTHIDYISKKIGKKIGFFSRIRKRMSTLCAINVYNTIIKPHFEYCSTIIYLGNITMIDRLQKLQNKAMRIILKCHWLTPIASMLSMLKWLSINQRTIMNVLVYVFKMKNGMLPSYLCDKINYVSNVHSHNVRNRSDFRLPHFRTRSAQNMLTHNGLKLFNGLPNDLKTETNLKIFKKKVVHFVRNRYAYV